MGMICSLIGHEWACSIVRNDRGRLDKYRDCGGCGRRQLLIFEGGIGAPDVWEDWTPKMDEVRVELNSLQDEMRQQALHARRCAAGVHAWQQVGWRSMPSGRRERGRECVHCRHFEMLWSYDPSEPASTPWAFGGLPCRVGWTDRRTYNAIRGAAGYAAEEDYSRRTIGIDVAREGGDRTFITYFSREGTDMGTKQEVKQTVDDDALAAAINQVELSQMGAQGVPGPGGMRLHWALLALQELQRRRKLDQRNDAALSLAWETADAWSQFKQRYLDPRPVGFRIYPDGCDGESVLLHRAPIEAFIQAVKTLHAPEPPEPTAQDRLEAHNIVALDDGHFHRTFLEDRVARALAKARQRAP